jgi:hypothetical protein
MNKDSLVDQVKNIQRSDIAAKQAWWDYCDKNLGGVRDPSKHDAAVLNTFVVGFNSGAIRAAPVVGKTQSSSGKGGGKGSMPDWMAAMAQWMSGAQGGSGIVGSSGADLQDFIKLGQRHSQPWKIAWQAYCTLNGSTKFDPAKYDKSYLVGFIDYLGQVANEDLAVAAAGQGIIVEGLTSNPAGVKRPMMSSDGPAGKRLNTGAGFGDPVKAALVERVKALQRSDENAKASWNQYCVDQLGGIKDPNRHDAAVLQQFIDSFGG